VFESKKLYDNQVGDWIKRVLSGKGYSIEPKGAAMLVEFLGNDLGKISNELDKLAIILPKGSTITPKIIEDNIGISKDYNVFELRKAIGEKDQLKAYKIADYFAQNPKDNPLVMTVGLVFGFFTQLLQYHGLKDKNPANVAKLLRVNPYFVKDYDIALRNYPMRKVSAIVATLRDIDVKSKGVGASSIRQSDLLREMLVKIFN
jgi:DNA polymerase-3 subunit delta